MGKSDDDILFDKVKFIERQRTKMFFVFLFVFVLIFIVFFLFGNFLLMTSYFVFALWEPDVSESWCDGVDFNKDGRVDSLDREILMSNFGSEVLYAWQGDLNNDGVVDEKDLDVFEEYYGSVGCQGCYVRFKISEEKVDNEVLFSLIDIENLHGFYSGHLPFYYSNDSFYGDYILRTYDKDGNVLDAYSIYSSRFILWDDFSLDAEVKGGVEETSSGVISVVLPMGSKVAEIDIENDGVITNLAFISFNLNCEAVCKLEDEIGYYDIDDECCVGLTRSRQDDESFVCTFCGDDVCSEFEDRYSCPQDCIDDFWD